MADGARTAVLLARSGSQRLPGKALLPWAGTTLLGNAARQTLLCPGIDFLIVGSDSSEYLDEALRAVIGEFEFPDGKQMLGVKRAPVPPEQTSHAGLQSVVYYDGYRGVLSQRNDHKNVSQRVLLVQCTSPYINPADLQLLLDAAEPPFPWVGYALSIDGKPTGMGYLVSPLTPPTEWRYIEQKFAPGDDVDTLQDYKQACDRLAKQPTIGAG